MREPYRQVIGSLSRNVRAGYLVKRGEEWFVQPALTPRDMGWSSEDAFLKVKDLNISSSDLPKYVRLDDPKYRPQIHAVKFDVEVRRGPRGSYLAVTRLAASQGYTGWLVCSGNMKEASQDRPDQRSPRKSQTLVLSENTRAKAIRVKPQAVKDYLAGLTPYQQEELTAWSEGKDSPHGCLYHGKPVFYVTEDNEVAYFGHSPNFRIPARLFGSNRAATPTDFVPDALRNDPRPDLADAIFGWVESNDSPAGQRAGRVFFEDARYVDAKDGVWLHPEPIIPHTLSGPKVTTFQHYLVQDHRTGHHPDKKETLAHYGSPPNSTQVRGHKQYWHRGASPDIEASAKEREHEKQLTRIIPVKAGVRFKFSVCFENLRLEELGALWWALALPGESGKDYRHKLGMGKPLGMGAVKITPRLILSDRCNQADRYGRLFDDSGWHLAERPAEAAQYTKLFERYVLDAVELRGATRLADVERIRMLLTMLEWREGTEQWLKTTSYMEVETENDKLNEYKERPVLADPLAVVAGNDAPLRSEERPVRNEPAPRPKPAQVTRSLPAQQGDARRTGAVTRWLDDRAYGFIKPDGSQERDVFMHISAVEGNRALQVGQRVSFEIVQGPKGMQAQKVRPIP
ncbi:MAG: TIGR03986 family CRISPR-associated RAMP protein [Anaerolineae bacterium]|nr:TIGR03986 family CRISPR-associated RAMP protein [Anaerolineae bacterium]